MASITEKNTQMINHKFLPRMKKKELQAVCERFGLVVDKRDTKAALVEKIKRSDFATLSEQGGKQGTIDFSFAISQQ